MIKLTDTPIDPAQVYSILATNGAGSVVLHYAVVKPLRDSSGITSHIDFTATPGTEAELAAIATSLVNEFTLTDTLLIRRIGRVAVGEIISLVAVSAPSSDHAFAACTAGLGRLRSMKEIVKSEVYG